MQRDPVLAAAIPSAIGAALIGLNFLSERWALSRIAREARGTLELESCGEGYGAASASRADCARVEPGENLTGLLPAFEAQHYFPSELLLVGMVVVGLVTARQASQNPYLTFILVAAALGLIRAVVAGSVFVPLVYFIVIGAGFALGHLFPGGARSG